MEEYRDWDGFDFKPKKNITIYPDKILEKVKPPATILEIGCDKGALSFELANAGYNVIGIDINQKAIEIAQAEKNHSQIKNVDFICADMCEEAEWNKINTQDIDAVILVKVLTVIPRALQRELLMKNIAKYLKPDTMIYIYDFKFNKDNPAYSSRYEEGYNIFKEMGTFDVKDENGNHMYYAHHHTQDEIDMLCSEFDLVSLEYLETISYHGNRADTFELVTKVKRIKKD
jgi:2-polyprenyl-3-methyl-5-hydroxy-6-metoxy-1,4-benzoquinol methylase